MSRFPYKYDVNKYIDEALKRLIKIYPWTTKEMFKDNYTYAIEKIDNKYKYVVYRKWFSSTDKEVYDYDGEQFIEQIISDNQISIEYANPVKEEFRIHSQREGLTGWYLEMYIFRSHELGGYSVYIQAGNESAGASKTMFFDSTYFNGTFDDFLNKYFDEMHAGTYGLSLTYLKEYKGLKEFLGFKE